MKVDKVEESASNQAFNTFRSFLLAFLDPYAHSHSVVQLLMVALRHC